MHTSVTLSCEAAQEKTGPTLVHSTGVKHYRIQPEIIRMLQEACTNEKLCYHEKGVQCSDPPARIVEVFKKSGFSVTSQSKAGTRKLWALTKTDEEGDKPKDPPKEEEGEKEEEEEEETEE